MDTRTLLLSLLPSATSPELPLSLLSNSQTDTSTQSLLALPSESRGRPALAKAVNESLKPG